MSTYPEYDLNLPFIAPEGKALEHYENMTNEIAMDNVKKLVNGDLTWTDLIAQAAFCLKATTDPDELHRLMGELAKLVIAAQDSLVSQVADLDVAFGDEG